MHAGDLKPATRTERNRLYRGGSSSALVVLAELQHGDVRALVAACETQNQNKDQTRIRQISLGATRSRASQRILNAGRQETDCTKGAKSEARIIRSRGEGRNQANGEPECRKLARVLNCPSSSPT